MNNQVHNKNIILTNNVLTNFHDKKRKLSIYATFMLKVFFSKIPKIKEIQNSEKKSEYCKLKLKSLHRDQPSA